jgi:hypothetical protein
LVLPYVEPEWLGRYATLHGEVGPGLLLGLSTPHPLIAVATLSRTLQGLACVEPREPTGEAGRADRWLRDRFADGRAQLPVGWIDAGEAETTLADGGSVYAAIERPADELPFFLPREIATRPVLVHRERDKRWHVAVGPPGSLDSAREAHVAHRTAWPGQTLLAR